jgi:hypothetical protein
MMITLAGLPGTWYLRSYRLPERAITTYILTAYLFSHVSKDPEFGHVHHQHDTQHLRGGHP